MSALPGGLGCGLDKPSLRFGQLQGRLTGRACTIILQSSRTRFLAIFEKQVGKIGLRRGVDQLRCGQACLAVEAHVERRII
jgi:hypothetical protein